MKRVFLVLMIALWGIIAYSQDNTADPPKSGKKFYAGVSYAYISTDTKLYGLSLHSVWYDQDLGTIDLTDDQIDTLNSFTDRSVGINCLNLEAGMWLLDDSGSKWKINGTVMFGISRSNTEIYNNEKDTLEYAYESPMAKPCFGIGFNFAYAFSKHWGISLRPFFEGTMGKMTDITDNINPTPQNFTSSGEDMYRSFYQRMSVMADFTAGHFTFSAGPGFYWISSYHKYRIERTNLNSGELLADEITSRTVNRSFIDGSLAVEWKITEPLTIYALAGIGKDLVVNTGIHVNF